MGYTTTINKLEDSHLLKKDTKNALSKILKDFEEELTKNTILISKYEGKVRTSTIDTTMLIMLGFKLSKYLDPLTDRCKTKDIEELTKKLKKNYQFDKQCLDYISTIIFNLLKKSVKVAKKLHNSDKIGSSEILDAIESDIVLNKLLSKYPLLDYSVLLTAPLKGARLRKGIYR